jgi:hypothetical protein
MCSLGASAGCRTVSRELLGKLDECSVYTNIAGPLENIGAFLLDNYAETLFFQELTNRSIRATDCQVKILEPSQRAPLYGSGWAIFKELLPILNLLQAQKQSLYAEFHEWDLAASDVRTAGTTGARAARKRIQSKIDSIDQSIKQLLSQLPFGSQPDIQRALAPLIGLNNVTAAQFNGAYASGLTATRTSLIEAQETFRSVQDPGTSQFNLSLSQKIELYSTPAAQSLMSQLDPQKRSLGCYFEACYKTGPRNAQIAAVVAILGATILTAGEAAPLLAAVTSLGAATFSAVQVQNSCFKSTTAATAEIYNNCSAYALANTAISQVSGIQCAVDAALASLDAVPGVLAVRQMVRARRLAESFSTIESAGVRYIRTNADGSVVTKAANGAETTRFLNGRSETIFSNGTRVVEENGIITTSYANGLKDVKANGITVSYLRDGTAFRRTHADGRIEELLVDNEVHVLNDITVTSPSRPSLLNRAVDSIQETIYNRNVRKYADEYRREHPRASRAQVDEYARAKAAAKRERLNQLQNRCTSVRANPDNAVAASLFTKYGIGIGAATTGISYTLATWDQVKDRNWGQRLGYEVVQAVILSYLTSKINASPGSSFIRKVTQNNLTAFIGNVGEALVHQGLFSSNQDAEAAVTAMASSPNFKNDVNKLLDYMNNRDDIQKFVDGMGDMSNNFLRAITGKERVEDMTAAELAALDQKSLQDPEVQMRMLDLVDDRLYSSGMNVTSGNQALDRLTFNTGYNLANVPIQTAIGIGTFYAVCMNVDNPVRAFMAFSSIQLARGSLSGTIYYRTRREIIDQ